MGAAVYIVCGGTGGHLAPGIATAQRLLECGIPVELVISEREVDSRLIRAYPEIPYSRAAGRPFSWRPGKLVGFVVATTRGAWGSFRRMRRERPEVVLAFGGFLSVSYVIAAKLLRIPVVLHEANRKAGKSIRFLAGWAETVFLPRGVSLSGIEPRRMRRTGMPLRREVHHIPKDMIRSRMDIPQQAKVLVVVGGSQGAQALNEWVARNRSSLAADGIWVILVAGPGKLTLPDLESFQADNGEPVEVRSFAFHNALHELFSCADVVVSRAGAGSIAELVECLAPSILVPLPSAADDHQTANARCLEQRGCCVLLPQEQLDNLYREVLDLIFNDWLLGQMRHNLRQLAEGDAAEDIATCIRVLVRGNGDETHRPPASEGEEVRIGHG